jgi:hypothetical protein
VQKGSFARMMKDFRENRRLILTVSIFDNFAWISFAISASMIPIVFAVAISESYIALAAFLGMIVNREVLMRHQKAGLFVSLASATALAAMVA